MRILLLGGGGLMGSGTIRDLLSPLSAGITEVTAAEPSAERLPKLDDPRLKTKILDVGDRQALLQALQDCDLCINGVPTFAGYQMAIFDACLEARRTYVDYGGMGVFTVKQKAYHKEFEARGVTAVIGLGADPGLSNVICRACADRLDTIDKINLYWTASRTGPAGPSLSPPYALSTLLAEYANPSQQFLDGRLQEVGPREGIETLDLDEPFGRTTFMFTQHSEPLTVPFAEGIREKGIREFTWRLAFPRQDHEAWLSLVRAGFGDFDNPVSVPGGVVKPLDVLQAVIRRHQTAHPSPKVESFDLHFARGTGTRDGLRAEVTVRVLGRPHPLYQDYSDAATSMNMSIGVQQIQQLGPRPGVWAPEEYFQPDRYLAQVRKRHFEVTVETRTWEER